MITAADADASPEICARRGAFPSPDEVVNGVEADQSHDDQIDRHDEAQHYRGRSHLSKSGVVLSLALNSLPPLVPENLLLPAPPRSFFRFLAQAGQASSASMLGKRQLPSTWPSIGDLRPRDGRLFSIITLPELRRWICSSRRCLFGCCMACSFCSTIGADRDRRGHGGIDGRVDDQRR